MRAEQGRERHLLAMLGCDPAIAAQVGRERHLLAMLGCDPAIAAQAA